MCAGYLAQPPLLRFPRFFLGLRTEEESQGKAGGRQYITEITVLLPNCLFFAWTFSIIFHFLRTIIELWLFHPATFIQNKTTREVSLMELFGFLRNHWCHL